MRAAIPRLQKRITELQAFDPETINGGSDPRLGALGRAIDETLVSIFGADTVDYTRYWDAARLNVAAVIVGAEPPLHEIRAGVAGGRARAISILEGIISRFNEELELASYDSQPTQQPAVALAHSRTVFVVHGHDEGARESVARFLEKIDLKPVILHERPNKGRTLITKFREESADIEFAVVLMTPDDHGAKAGEANTQPRARQNVVFELGFFIGALGPERVAALVKGDIERPSDFDGVVYIDLDDAGAWKQQLGRELQAAGFQIDWNKVMS